MKLITIFLLATLLSTSLIGQVAFIINSLPDYTPADDLIYLAGDLNGWDPGNPDFALAKNNEDKWEIVLPQEPNGTIIQFKFTLGDWGTVEKGAQGEEISNREFVYGNGDTVYVDILNWADNGGGGNSTAAENVSIMDEKFHMPQFNRDRRIWVYLPPDYNISTKHYPVLYMHDGQNLFDTYTSFAGEWEVDETLNELYDEGYQVPIVVGIDNGGSERIDEYTPWVNATYGGGQGELYIDFLINTLKPTIDEKYRTLSQRENTAIMGSSLGGLISHYGALSNQDVFGKSGIFSPSYWFSDSVWTFTSDAGKQENMKLYQLMGSEEGEGEAVDHMWQMDSLLTELGFGDDELFSIEIPNGEHNEALWRENFRDAYLWLFNEFASGINKLYVPVQIILSPNPAIDYVLIPTLENNNYDSLKILDMLGRVVVSKADIFSNKIDIRELDSGNYILIVTAGDNSYSGKFIKQ